MRTVYTCNDVLNGFNDAGMSSRPIRLTAVILHDQVILVDLFANLLNHGKENHYLIKFC